MKPWRHAQLPNFMQRVKDYITTFYQTDPITLGQTSHTTRVTSELKNQETQLTRKDSGEVPTGRASHHPHTWLLKLGVLDTLRNSVTSPNLYIFILTSLQRCRWRITQPEKQYKKLHIKDNLRYWMKTSDCPIDCQVNYTVKAQKSMKSRGRPIIGADIKHFYDYRYRPFSKQICR